MSTEADPDATLSVSEDGVTVEKSFAADEFPVPAVRFHLASRADEPTHVRLVDEIPESFPMESVGFHPDFESDNWTAYKDHRVEYSRTLDPGAELVTVYGVRLDEGDDPAAFLTQPSLTERPLPEAERLDSEDIDDVIGSDDNVVREVLSGERDSLPGLDGPGEGADPTPEPVSESAEPSSAAGVEAGAAAVEAAPVPAADEDEGEGESANEASAPAPREMDDDLRPAVTRRDPDAETTADLDAEAAVESDAEETAEPAANPDDADDAPEADSADDAPAADAGAADDPVSAESVARGPESVAAALVAEVNAGEVEAADLDRLREALAPEGAASSGDASPTTNSQDVRIRRLQSKVEDLAAYADAMAEFIDDNGTGSQLIAEMNEELGEVDSELDALHGRVSGVEDAQDGVRDEVRTLGDDVDAAAGRAESAAERAEAANDRADEAVDRAASNADRIDDATADAADAAERIESLDDELGDVREDVASVDADVVSLREDADRRADGLERDVSRVRGDVADLRDAVEELEAFRGRLNSAFGGVGEEEE